jgi:hypothetical protein
LQTLNIIVRTTLSFPEDKGKVSQEASAFFNWTLIGRAIEEKMPQRRQWLTKHKVGMCGVAAVLKQWKQQTIRRLPKMWYQRNSYTWLELSSTENNLFMG